MLWEEIKIKEIKELTAKGLEPEVEKIISNHKTEMSAMEEKYLLEMKTMKEKIIRRKVRQKVKKKLDKKLKK